MPSRPRIITSTLFAIGFAFITHGSPGQTLDEPWFSEKVTAPPPITETMATILARDPISPASSEQERTPLPVGVLLPPDPNLPPFEFYGDPYMSTGFSPRFPAQAISIVNATSAQFGGTPTAPAGFSNENPPDPMGDIGEAGMLVCVNGLIRFMNRGGGQVWVTSTNAFFAALGPFTRSFDPMVRYDRFSDRWFVSMLSGGSTVMLAVSSDDSPGLPTPQSGEWSFYRFDAQASADYVSMSVDFNAVYFGVDVPSTPRRSRVMVVSKSDLLAGATAPDYFRFPLTSVYRPRAADNEERDAARGYLVSFDVNCSIKPLKVLVVTNPASDMPMLSELSIPVATWTPPTRSPQPRLSSISCSGGAAQDRTACRAVDALDRARRRRAGQWTSAGQQPVRSAR